MFCHQCGQKLPEDARFCMRCGTAVIADIGNQRREETISDEYRKKVYDELAEAMLMSLERGEITVEGAQESAQFVLDHLDTIQTQEELAGFLGELTEKFPIYQTVAQALHPALRAVPAPPQQARAEIPAQEAEQFAKRVQRISEAGTMSGEVTEDIFQEALALYEELESSINLTIRDHPKKELLRSYLLPYHQAQQARFYLQKRWEEDRQKRPKSFLRRQRKLVVTDYLIFSQQKIAWEFIDYLQIPTISLNLQSLVLACPRLLPYFSGVVLEDLFVALLMDGEDPKTYTEAFAGIKKNYGEYAEQLLKRLTTSY